MEAAGLHLLQTLALVDSPRRSAVARLDARGRLVALDLVASDEEILAALPPSVGALAVDAPLAVPDDRGRRDLEKVLAWCDVPAFPTARRRLEQVHGGIRGEALAPRIGAGRRLAETLPGHVLRELLWEREHPLGAAPLPLADYRAQWLPLRPPEYRPKGAGRAKPAGLLPAHRLLAEVVDLCGWAPVAAPGDDWGAIADAARLDAIACAYAAWRAATGGEEASVTVGTPQRGMVVLPADANLRERLALNLERLREEGAVRI